MTEAAPRQVEIFSAGCPACTETIDSVDEIACPSCTISVHDMHDPAVAGRRGRGARCHLFRPG